MTSLLGGSTGTQVADYRMSWHIGVAGTVDEVREVYLNEKALGLGEIIRAATSRAISNTGFFGGDKSGGGLDGILYYLLGAEDQQCPDVLKAKLGGGLVPAFRHTCTLFFTGGSGNGFKFGSNNAYLPTIAAKVFAACHVLDDNSKIGDDLVNPAHYIYEIMTSKADGMSEDESNMDKASYLACAQVLRNEGFGIAVLWDFSTSIEDHIKTVLNHINATQDVDPRTGLWTMRLLRPDYEPSTLPYLDASNSTLVNFQRKLPAETVNEVVVTWTNPVNEQTETVRSQNLALIESQGGVVSSAVSYIYVRNSGLAQSLAERDLQTNSMPLATAQVKTDRSQWDLMVGDLRIVSFPTRNVAATIMRVVKVNYGQPSDQTITVDLSQDIFGVVYNAYTDVNTKSDSQSLPLPVAFTRLLTATYFQTAQAFGDSAAQGLGYGSSYAQVLAAAPTGNTISVDAYSPVVNAAGGLEVQQVGTFDTCARSALSVALPVQASSLLVSLGALNVGVGDFVLATSGATDEWMLVTSITGGLTVARGVLDTVPLAWPANTVLWGVRGTARTLDTTLRMAAATAQYQLLTNTTQGQLTLDKAPVVSEVMSARPFLPTRNANVSVNGKLFSGAALSVADTITVSWARRNRTTETSQVLAWTDGDVYPETNQTTSIQVLDATGTTVYKQWDALTGTSFQTTSFDAFPTGTNTLIVRVSSARDGYASLTSADVAITFTK